MKSDGGKVEKVECYLAGYYDQWLVEVDYCNVYTLLVSSLLLCVQYRYPSVERPGDWSACGLGVVRERLPARKALLILCVAS